jgi:hypothetical protein
LSSITSATTPIAIMPMPTGDEYHGVATGTTGADDGLSAAPAPAPTAVKSVAYQGVDELFAAGDDDGTFHALGVDDGVSPDAVRSDDATDVPDPQLLRHVFHVSLADDDESAM